MGYSELVRQALAIDSHLALHLAHRHKIVTAVDRKSDAVGHAVDKHSSKAHVCIQMGGAQRPCQGPCAMAWFL